MRCAITLLVLAVLAVSASAMQPKTDAALQPAAAAKVPILTNGVWRHASLVTRSLLKVGHEVQGPRNDGGLATKGAERAHYATLAGDNTWSVSKQYCTEHGGQLCSASALCADGKPIGADEIPSGLTAYSPVGDSTNDWVQLSGDKVCENVRAPSWGESATKMTDSHSSKHLVACCKKSGKVIRSYLVPDGALVDPALAHKLKAAEHKANKAASLVHRMQSQINSLTSKVGSIEASSGNSAAIAELREALHMRGNSPLVQATRSGACCGMTPTGATPWVQYSHTGIYVDINISKCGFKTTPSIVSSLTGATSHWVSTGASSIYSPHPNGFRVYINYPAAMTPATANAYRWALNWCARAAN